MTQKVCSYEGCTNVMLAKSWCSTHYRRNKLYGDPSRVLFHLYTDPEDAFKARTARNSKGCLVWTGSTNPHGYGQIRIKGKLTQVHRYAYESEYGLIPKGMFVDHKCHTRACAEVNHLRLVTNKQNMENPAGVYSTNTSGYRNVVWSSQQGRWAVQLTHNYKKYHGGFFDDVEEANLAAIALRDKHFTHHKREEPVAEANSTT